MATTPIPTPAQLAHELASAGFKVLSITPADEQSDAEIKLEGGISIQFAPYDGGYCVNLWVAAEGAMYHGPMRTCTAEIVFDIRAAQGRTGRFTPVPE